MNMEAEAESLKIQIMELQRMEFDIQEDIEKLYQDLERVRKERTLKETQLRLIEDKQLGRTEE